jgi:hypothetical protein
MLTLLDGPAKEAGIGTLFCQRAPLFLRVVVDTEGKWDALDQIDDEPDDGERIYVYRREGEAGCCHVRRFVHGRNASGFFATGNYRYQVDQPEDSIVRSRSRWQEWCLMQVEDGAI